MPLGFRVKTVLDKPASTANGGCFLKAPFKGCCEPVERRGQGSNCKHQCEAKRNHGRFSVGIAGRQNIPVSSGEEEEESEHSKKLKKLSFMFMVSGVGLLITDRDV